MEQDVSETRIPDVQNISKTKILNSSPEIEESESDSSSESDSEVDDEDDEQQGPIIVEPAAEEEPYIPPQQDTNETTLIPGLEPVVLRGKSKKYATVKYTGAVSRSLNTRYNFKPRHKKNNPS